MIPQELLEGKRKLEGVEETMGGGSFGGGFGRADADDGHEAAARGAFLAVAEEEIAAAGGAEIADEDVLGAEAGAEELCAIGFAEVEQDVFGWGLVARRHPVQPLDRIGLIAGAELIEPFGSIGKLGLKLDGNLRADFVTAAADGGADGSEKICGLGAELHLHLTDGFDDDAGESATPPGMDGGDGAFLGIDEEDGDAIGGLNGEEQAGAIGDRGVSAARIVGSGIE